MHLQYSSKKILLNFLNYLSKYLLERLMILKLFADLANLKSKY